jgi:ferredoxin--NADP+ reductase
LPGADVIVRAYEVELDPLSRAKVEKANDRVLARKGEILQGYGQRQPEGKPKRLHVRFLVSPVELLGDERGHVKGMRLVRNKLVSSTSGAISAEATGEFEEIDVGLVFRSVGYRGVSLPDVPFDERKGIVPNNKGRATDPASNRPVTGVYATGWIKRGPSGVIGTNKPDAVETVASMVADAQQGAFFQPAEPTAAAAEALVLARQPLAVTYPDWQRLDALECSNGQACGRPRVKFVTIEEMLAALGRGAGT